MTDFVFNGFGNTAEFRKLELETHNGQVFYCFYILCSPYLAKKKGYTTNYANGEVILAFPEYRNGYKNVHEFRNMPGSRIYLVETDWENRDTPFSLRRQKTQHLIDEKIKLKKDLQRQLEARELEFERITQSAMKEIKARKRLVREGYKEERDRKGQ